MSDNQQVVTVSKDRLDTLKALLIKSKDSFASVLPKHCNPDRMVKLAITAASRNPLLLQCEPKSILLTMMNASELGLEPNSPLGKCYIIPYKNGKTGVYEAQFQVGYKGLIELALRGGEITNIESHIVYKGEQFECSFGLKPILEHKPNFSGERMDSDILCVYAIAHLKNGGSQYEIMSKKEIDSIRERSKAKSYGPWITDYGQMTRKTVIKRLMNYLPLSTELERAIAFDNAAEIGESQINLLDSDLENNDNVIDNNTGEVIPPTSKSEQLANELNQK